MAFALSAPPPPVTAIVEPAGVAAPSGPLPDLRDPAPQLTIRVAATACHWTYRYATAAGDLAFDPGRTPCADRACSFGLDPGRAAWVPVNRVVRVEVTSSDADSHRLSLPGIGIAVGAIPGRIDSLWFEAEKRGVYPGSQDATCAADHTSPPIAFRAVDDDAFRAWLDRGAR